MAGLDRLYYCNLALDRLKRHRLSALDDSDPVAVKAGQNLDRVYRSAIGKHNWRFCLRRAKLQKITPTDEDEKNNNYTERSVDIFGLPPDFVRLVMQKNVYDFSEAGHMSYDMIGNKVEISKTLQHDGNVFIEYLSDSKEVILPPYFEDYFVAELASAFYSVFIGDRSDLGSQYRTDADLKLRSATSEDAKNRRLIPFYSNPINCGRFLLNGYFVSSLL